MIRWICGTKLEDETPSANLLKKLDIADISAVLRSRRLRWAGHVQRATSWIKTITDFLIPGVRGRGRPRKTWRECLRKDEQECGLSGANRKTESHGEQACVVVWCCRPHRMGQEKHPKHQHGYHHHIISSLLL